MIKYLLEIKNRLTLLFVAWLSTVLVSYFYKETLLFTITQPYTILSIKESTNISYFIFTDVTEILHAYLNLITFLSFQVLYMYTTYHLFLFLSPAFFYMEYLFCKFGIKVMITMWIVSLMASSYVLIPITWHFFLSFQNLNLKHSLNLHFEAKLKEYLSFYISSYFLYQFYFQLFTFFLIFFYYTNFSKKKLKKSRKLNYYCFIILSTIFSPPEILSQLCIILIVIFIYEFTFFILLVKKHC